MIIRITMENPANSDFFFGNLLWNVFYSQVQDWNKHINHCHWFKRAEVFWGHAALKKILIVAVGQNALGNDFQLVLRSNLCMETSTSFAWSMQSFEELTFGLSLALSKICSGDEGLINWATLHETNAILFVCETNAVYFRFHEHFRLADIFRANLTYFYCNPCTRMNILRYILF